MLDNQGQVECNENKTVKDGDILPSTRDQTFDHRSLYIRLWSVLVRPDWLLDHMTVIIITTMTVPKSGAEKHWAEGARDCARWRRLLCFPLPGETHLCLFFIFGRTVGRTMNTRLAISPRNCNSRRTTTYPGKTGIGYNHCPTIIKVTIIIPPFDWFCAASRGATTWFQMFTAQKSSSPALFTMLKMSSFSRFWIMTTTHHNYSSQPLCFLSRPSWETKRLSWEQELKPRSRKILNRHFSV